MMEPVLAFIVSTTSTPLNIFVKYLMLFPKMFEKQLIVVQSQELPVKNHAHRKSKP